MIDRQQQTNPESTLSSVETKLKFVDRPFRIDKLNFVWSKAIKSRALMNDPVRIQKFRKDLLEFDALYLDLKHSDHYSDFDSPKKESRLKNVSPKRDDQNQYRLSKKSVTTKQIDERLDALLGQRYGLDPGILHAFRMKYKYNKNSNNLGSHDFNEKHNIHRESVAHPPQKTPFHTYSPFDDPRLAKLWHDLNNSSLVVDELPFVGGQEGQLLVDAIDELFNDLVEHQQKLHHYSTLVSEAHQREQLENHVHDDSSDQSENSAQGRHTAFLKALNKELEANMEGLQHRALALQQNLFHRDRLRQIWKKALKYSNHLIADELDMIRGELRYIELRMDSLDKHSTGSIYAQEEENVKVFEATPASEDNSDLFREKLERKLLKLERYLEEKAKLARAKTSDGTHTRSSDQHTEL